MSYDQICQVQQYKQKLLYYLNSLFKYPTQHFSYVLNPLILPFLCHPGSQVRSHIWQATGVLSKEKQAELKDWEYQQGQEVADGNWKGKRKVSRSQGVKRKSSGQRCRGFGLLVASGYHVASWGAESKVLHLSNQLSGRRKEKWHISNGKLRAPETIRFNDQVEVCSSKNVGFIPKVILAGWKKADLGLSSGSVLNQVWSLGKLMHLS